MVPRCFEGLRKYIDEFPGKSFVGGLKVTVNKLAKCFDFQNGMRCLYDFRHELVNIFIEPCADIIHFFFSS